MDKYNSHMNCWSGDCCGDFLQCWQRRRRSMCMSERFRDLSCQEKVFVITLCDGQSALLPNTLVSTSSWLQRVYPPVRVLRDLVLRMQVSLVAAMPQHLPGAQTMRGARSLSHHPAHCVGFLLRSTSTLLDPSSR
eukprot:682273-Amphidinium_carterae.1